MRINLTKKLALVVSGLALIAVGLGVIIVVGVLKKAPEEVAEKVGSKREVIGRSVEGREIEVYSYGNGPTHLLFIGGIHGGYEWNSVLLAYEFIDYFNQSPEGIPENLTVSIVPNANPDGVFAVLGKEGNFSSFDIPAGDLSFGRFNANGVDLNRNFDCKWRPQSTWRGETVSAGTEPFSEPEARAIRDFVLAIDPAAVVFWHSQAGAVYASECEGGILPETLEITKVYANASDYQAIDTFDAYEVTGDAEGWLAFLGIPSITVELSTHEVIEFERNIAGVKSLFEHYR